MSPTYSVCSTHGYLAGEQAICPHCGAKTEIYSRITGYYRPVQNWNDGKAQEFRDRLVYDIGHSRLTHQGPVKAEPAPAEPAAQKAETVPAPAEKPEASAEKTTNPGIRSLLFVSATCPNCKLAVNMLEKAGFLFKKVLATENVELTRKYGVKQAPTLVVMDQNGVDFEKFKGVSEIKGMLTQRQVG